ncbi:MAG: hypothetical protein JW717_15045 [Marinilabiliaceae bacterium]|nr:hypothetical protein [Marinilabiliaceae bacterium]
MVNNLIRTCGILIVLIIKILFTNTVLYGQLDVNRLFQIMQSERIDSLYFNMTPEQRISQLFWITAEEIKNDKRFNERIQLIEKYQPGGVLFMKNDLESIKRFIVSAKNKSKTPIIFSIDAEWGLAMRIDGLTSFPKAMTMGAVKDLSLHYKMGQELAKQMRVLGIHVNMAPVADVNINAKNPIIGVRSFGENQQKVTQRAVAYMLGMQDGGIMAVAKHFPGHGDTNIDSHLDLPCINGNYQRLSSVELVPFYGLIKNGVLGIMSGHLNVPALDSVSDMPASLSDKIISDLLKLKMGFSGLVITDAMNMKGVKKFGEPGRLDVLALIAGNDVIESTEDLPKAIVEAKKAIEAGEITWDLIEDKCKKTLALKELLQINKEVFFDKEVSLKLLNASVEKGFIQTLYNRSITFIGDKKYEPLDISRVRLIKLGQFDNKHVLNTCEEIGKDFEMHKYNGVERVFVGIENSKQCIAIWNSAEFQKKIADLTGKIAVVVVYVGSPYGLSRFVNIDKVDGVLLGYEKNEFTYIALNYVIGGNILPLGVLPVTINEFFRERCGE